MSFRNSEGGLTNTFIDVEIFRFVLVSAIKEDHKKAIYSVTFNPFLHPNTNPVFATVGGRQLTIYQCNIHGEPGGTTVLQV